jgi:hypothetical protein
LEDYRENARDRGQANKSCPDVQFPSHRKSKAFSKSSVSKIVAISRVSATLRMRKVREQTELLLSPITRSVDRLGTESFL